MKIYAISDLHLSTNCDKPMDIFGGNWEGYTDKIVSNWKSKVTDDDYVLIAGDISWAMRIEDAVSDLEWIDALPGKKIIIKGNHEYWWKSISAVRAILPESIQAIQNDAIKLDDVIICGTRGWTVPEPDKEFLPEDEKIYKREVERLKLTLMSAKHLQTNDERIICMMHFPPHNAQNEQSDFMNLFEEFGVSDVVFGHLHGYTNCKRLETINGINYYFTSCDHIGNDPVLIYE